MNFVFTSSSNTSPDLDTMEVELLDRPKELRVDVDPEQYAEDALLNICRQSLVFRPTVVSLFGLRTASGHWLAPNQHLSQVGKEHLPLELRLRFKVPHPAKLYDVDKEAFMYYFLQVKRDFCRGEAVKAYATQLHQSESLRKNPWWLPFIPIESENEAEEEESATFYRNVAKLASILMAVDVLDKGKTVKEVVKNAQHYVPNETYSNPAKKFFLHSKFKDLTEFLTKDLIDKKWTSLGLKRTFLSDMEGNFETYFEDHFRGAHRPLSGQWESVKLVFKPPFKKGNEEREPSLSMELLPPNEQKKNMFSDNQQKELCTLEDICNISVGGEDWNRIELSRRNGIPLYFMMNGRLEAMAFLSHLSGYYRLCEKWTFSLCSVITYPSLEFNMTNSIHGPVTPEFVEEKFMQKARNKPGSFLLRQSCEKHDQWHIHFLSDPADGRTQHRPDVKVITKTPNGAFKLAGMIGEVSIGSSSVEFATIKEMIKFLRTPASNSSFLLRDCLHPSEYDRAPTLLLCRSIVKLKADCTEGSGPQTEPRMVIPFNQLSRVENKKLEGKFTTVWMGTWQGKGKKKQTVAIKQLKRNHQATKLLSFSQLSYDSLLWDDSTLVRSLGVCLGTFSSPMALITEYFTLGPLDSYLLQKTSLRDVDLVEACACLARALWYLEESGSIRAAHGNVRCSNVFVDKDDGDCFKVKLGDCGLTEVYPADQVHWLPFELLLLDKPSPDQLTIKGDVWALATTYWQIFSYGAVPLMGTDPEEARHRYLAGDRLSKPPQLKGYLGQIYEIMLSCWNPNPDARKEPQAVMRDMNQLLYRVFNSKQIHNYMTVEKDEREGSANANWISPDNWSDDGSGRSSIETITTKLDMGSISSHQQLQHTTGLPNQHHHPILSHTHPQIPMENGGATHTPTSRQVLVPTYHEMSRRFLEQNNGLYGSHGVGGVCTPDVGGFFAADRGVVDPLINNTWGGSRPSSSMSGGLFNNDASAFTSQTSLASFSTLYSMSSIYQLSSESQLELNTEFPLGEGNFGVVYKGVLSKSNGDWDQVAVKTLKASDGQPLSVETCDELRCELDIMRKLNHHNVVKVKAVFQDERKVLIIMEYIEGGSLDKYLYVNRDLIEIPKQLFIFAQNIVEGMEYLGRKGVIHRDLAARNILVANEELVKISDFGLARSVGQDHYVMSSNANIPVRWLAVECLTHKIYSFASDVWSFGVTMWEMFSLGAIPALEGCQGFFKAGASDEQQREDLKCWLQFLEDGVRLPRPELCPATAYFEVMLPCWQKDPRLRPTFTGLKQAIKKAELRDT